MLSQGKKKKKFDGHEAIAIEAEEKRILPDWT